MITIYKYIYINIGPIIIKFIIIINFINEIKYFPDLHVEKVIYIKILYNKIFIKQIHF